MNGRRSARRGAALTSVGALTSSAARLSVAACLAATAGTSALAVAGAPAPGRANLAGTPTGWRACAELADDRERLACFDRWSGRPASADAAANRASAIDVSPSAAPGGTEATSPAPPQWPAAAIAGCRSPRSSELSRYWELEEATDCGTFQLRGYRPLSLSVTTANRVNRQPTSPAPGRTASTSVPYRTTEMRVQLSVRTKLATGLLTGLVPPANPKAKDSLWFGYTQQSYWQLFTGDISRPFRATDHEPEVVYVYPADFTLPLGWRLRYAGLGLVHQSNGQSLPLSRSWNRAYLMAGAELGDRWVAQARVWRRSSIADRDDDNPDVSDRVGRAELKLDWHANALHTFAVTLRHPLNGAAGGSVRAEWLRTLGADSDGRGNLRLHTQLFSGYGDSLIDYNFRRTMFSVGLSLIDF